MSGNLLHIHTMTHELFKLTLTREQLTCLQVALLEAQIDAHQDSRKEDAERYLSLYSFIGMEKCRVLTNQTS